MTVVALGASGGTGRHVVEFALARGVPVRALVRDPARAGFAPRHDLEVVPVDVHDPATVAGALGPEDVLVSTLGSSRKAAPGTLTAGAQAVLAAAPRRIVWMGAAGTGPSAHTTGRFTRTFLAAVMGDHVGDKERADPAVLEGGGVVVHVGRLEDSATTQGHTLVPAARVPRTFSPHGASRREVARLLVEAALDEGVAPGLHLVRRLG
ncbi:NAD(P)H-binding protein [Kineococcus sp. SYSU DK003]|uniref:NAD(P)H-binding protein n=1 Tax=Kineococcus sp. SYSU DK003 TaxID=3383124 RepID=UPI003D7E8E1A